MASEQLSLEHIREASEVVDPVFRSSPQYVDAALSRRLGTPTILKLEVFNPIGSFKGRGADYLMREIPEGRRVTCASAGNFGQAIAYAGRARGVHVTVFAAETANPAKVARMRELGGDVRLVGSDFDAAKAAAQVFADDAPDEVFVEDGREPRIAEGAGTIGVELAPLHADTLVLPVGNGALIAGVGRWMRAHSPQTRIVGVCAAGAPSMALSWRARSPVPSTQVETIADGIAVREPVPEAVEQMCDVVDDVLLVDEEEIVRAMQVLRDDVGILVEPAGAVSIAAALQHGLSTGTLALVVTGNNYSPETLQQLRRP